MSNAFLQLLTWKFHVKSVPDGFDIEIPCQMWKMQLLTWKFHVKFYRESGRASRKIRTRMPQGTEQRAASVVKAVRILAVLAVLAVWAV